MTHWHNLSFEG